MDFPRPDIKISFFGPLDSTEKMTNIDVSEDLNGRQLMFRQPLTAYTNFAGCHLKFMAIFLFINTTYAFDGWIIRAPAFFPFFFNKK